MITGEWPNKLIDHIDGDPSNNRFANLRMATFSQNSANSRVHSINASGRKGVFWHKQCGKWMASITIFGKQKHLGLFDEIEDAANAYDRAARDAFGEFARSA